MIQFEVFGPTEITLEKLPYGRMVSRDLSKYWEANNILKEKHGCYVFGMRAGGGISPYYVGKALRTTFFREAFSDRNLANFYIPCMLENKGTPVMFYVVPKANVNNAIRGAISDIEKFLITKASQKNANAYNNHHAKKTALLSMNLSIAGVLHSPGKGLSTKASRDFCKMMGGF